MSHNNNPCAQKSTKEGGKYTEPELPPKTVVDQDGVKIDHYTRSNDHGPPHMHVKGGGPETKIGQNGKPIESSPEPTAQQKRVIDENLSKIRKAIRKIGRYFWYNNL